MQRVLKGALAGAAAWSAMDGVLRFLYNHQDPATRRQEDEARGGVPALEVMAERSARIAGVTLSAAERQGGGTFLQWAVGIGAGMLYAALRDHLPGSGIRRGIFYGAAFSLLVDEGVVPRLDFAPGPSAFSWQTHARGFAAHLVYGTVVEITMGWLDRIDEHSEVLSLIFTQPAPCLHPATLTAALRCSPFTSCIASSRCVETAAYQQ